MPERRQIFPFMTAAAVFTLTAAFACQNVPPIYRNTGMDLSRKKSGASSGKSTGQAPTKSPYFVTLGSGDSRSASGRYEQCETGGVRARIIRQSNGAKAVYAYGWDAREAEVLDGKYVRISGRMTWRHGDLKPADMKTSAILGLPHFLKVQSINRVPDFSGMAPYKSGGDCLK